METTARVLLQLPESQLLIHHTDPEFDNEGSRVVQQLTTILAGYGVAPERITFIGNRTHSEHLRVISKVDIALDTFPFAGQTTTCECLWMGVPVVTLRGDRHCSRVGAALLAQICLNDWIVDDCDEYVSITLKKAAQSQELQQLRSSLRDKISSSTLADGDRHAREVLRISRELWRARLAAE